MTVIYIDSTDKCSLHLAVATRPEFLVELMTVSVTILSPELLWQRKDTFERAGYN